jgi:hypothetical protein
MRRAIWIVVALSLAGCGGGSKSSATVSVTCAGGVQLRGADSVDVLGDLANGRPVMEFPDPANAGKTGAIAIPPHDHCKVSASGG